MYIYQDAYLKWFVIIYFVMVIIICSFFLINLTVAVMLGKYEELDKSEDSEKHKNELRNIGYDIGLPKELTEYLINKENIELKVRSTKKKKKWCRSYWR